MRTDPPDRARAPPKRVDRRSPTGTRYYDSALNSDYRQAFTVQ